MGVDRVREQRQEMAARLAGVEFTFQRRILENVDLAPSRTGQLEQKGEICTARQNGRLETLYIEPAGKLFGCSSASSIVNRADVPCR